jgi:hypothetical protein
LSFFRHAFISYPGTVTVPLRRLCRDE